MLQSSRQALEVDCHAACCTASNAWLRHLRSCQRESRSPCKRKACKQGTTEGEGMDLKLPGACCRECCSPMCMHMRPSDTVLQEADSCSALLSAASAASASFFTLTWGWSSCRVRNTATGSAQALQHLFRHMDGAMHVLVLGSSMRAIVKAASPEDTDARQDQLASCPTGTSCSTESAMPGPCCCMCRCA